MSVSVRIITVPERSRLLGELVWELEVSGINNHKTFIDPDHNGCWWNARRAWVAPSNADWTLVLSDDAQVGRSFGLNLGRALDAAPGPVVTLMSVGEGYRLGSSWVAHWHSRAGVALAIRGEHRQAMVRWSDENVTEKFQADDFRVLNYARSIDSYLFECVPNIVQHRTYIDDEPIDSCIHGDRPNSSRSSKQYVGDDAVIFTSTFSMEPETRSRARLEKDRAKSLERLRP